MIDPRVVLVLLAVYGVIWGVGKAVHGVEVLHHKINHAAVTIVHKVADAAKKIT